MQRGANTRVYTIVQFEHDGPIHLNLCTAFYIFSFAIISQDMAIKQVMKLEGKVSFNCDVP